MKTSNPGIWQLQAHHDVAALIEALSHDDPDTRARAAAALRVLDAEEALSTLEEALAAEKDEIARDSIACAVIYFNPDAVDAVAVDEPSEIPVEPLPEVHSPPPAIPDVPDQPAESPLDPEPEPVEAPPQADLRELGKWMQLLQSADAAEALVAARMLGKLGDKRAVGSLVALFSDERVNDDVRYVAAESLLELQCAPSVVTLVAALRRGRWERRCDAATALGELNATWAVPALADALRDESEWVQESARDALQILDTPNARAALKEWERLLAPSTTIPIFQLPLTEDAGPPDRSESSSSAESEAVPHDDRFSGPAPVDHPPDPA